METKEISKHYRNHDITKSNKIKYNATKVTKIISYNKFNLTFSIAKF